MSDYAITDALEARRQAVETWASKDGVDRALQFYLGMLGIHPDAINDGQADELIGNPEVKEDISAIISSAMTELQTARVYVVADHIAAGLAQAQANLPTGVPFGQSMLPVPTGYCYLEGDHLRAPHPHRPGGDVVRALAWGSTPIVHEDDPLHVRVQVWVDRGWPLTWRQNLLIPDGYDWEAIYGQMELAGDSRKIRLSSQETKQTGATIIRFLLALGAFVSERVVADDVIRPDRAARRRLQRELGAAYVEPETHVLRMRELEHHVAQRRGLGGPDWSCSWVVSSHWRRQYHPSDGSHRLKLIHPYVKGDRTKPLRVSGSPVVRHIVR